MKLTKIAVVVAALAVSNVALAKDPPPVKVNVPTGINHGSYDQLLKKYVNSRGLVAYAKWKRSAADRKALNDYLAQYAASGTKAEGNEKAADLANGYNAFTIQWILQNYPTDSIWQLDKSFEAKRHKVGGKDVSLNDIEKGTLAPLIGYRDHAILVCAARSCPPLSRDAYSAVKLDAQVGAAYARWLGRPDLNEFRPSENAVEISSIFKWYQKDFAKVGGVPKVLAMYAPPKYQKFLKNTNYTVNFKTYNWGLNDQGSHGRNYSTPQFLLDKIF